LEFHQHLGSLKHVINIIIWFRDMGCYKWPQEYRMDAAKHQEKPVLAWSSGPGY
jgi:hypothetical protein